ncbi:glycosyltransferase family 39 protein [Kineosporia sp. J2-2]|uniref:Glycosyltransferase family 39 protein n=1 Tax=Kineosporia corallincola TaxID=2835133 RepID=A0ABS5T8U9_9ACTN|nr:glycosyltransferase family 39 protein [Kineosporia corallincola]MBT0767462.1 glycosyltransferase family 39 protein [Kineosporia corallincola]
MTQTTGREPDGRVPSASETRLDTTPPGSRGVQVLRRPGGPQRLARLENRTHDLLARPWFAEALVALVCAVVFCWRVGRASAWWDEAVTRDVIARPTTEILDLTGHVDLVHAAYYLLAHALFGSTGSFALIRMLSVVAAVITGVLLVRLGRELGSGRVGLAAGLLWVIAPLASRYAQEARPYALVAMMATAATLALVRVCRKPWLRARWAVYIACLAGLGLFNVIGLTIISAHLCYVLATSAPRVRRRWYLSAGLAVLALCPLLWFSSQQSAQVSWLPVPALARLIGFFEAQYVVGWIVLGLVVLAFAGLGRGTHNPALALGLTWSVVPPVVLWTISQVHPLYDWRYVFFTVPGTALALASLATLLRARYLAVVLLVLALGGAHMQSVYRYKASGHAENLRGVAMTIEDGAQPGDAVVFLPSSRRVVKLAYPQAFDGVDDIALAQTGEQSDSLFGVEESTEDITKALRKVTRVWVVTSNARLGESAEEPETEKERLLYDHFRVTGVENLGTYQVLLYQRSSKEAGIVTTGSASS